VPTVSGLPRPRSRGPRPQRRRRAGRRRGRHRPGRRRRLPPRTPQARLRRPPRTARGSPVGSPERPFVSRSGPVRVPRRRSSPRHRPLRPARRGPTGRSGRCAAPRCLRVEGTVTAALSRSPRLEPGRRHPAALHSIGSWPRNQQVRRSRATHVDEEAVGRTRILRLRRPTSRDAGTSSGRPMSPAPMALASRQRERTAGGGRPCRPSGGRACGAVTVSCPRERRAGLRGTGAFRPRAPQARWRIDRTCCEDDRVDVRAANRSS
jgi:hypothetical protein